MENKIVKKIKKLLALSKSSNENEAQNAMLKVQELLMKHRLSMKEVENYDIEDINVDEKVTDFTFTKAKWKGELATIIADNLSCYCYFKTYRTNKITFMGKSEDVLICEITLKYAIDFICDEVRKLKNEYRRQGYSVAGLKSDYAKGFIFGLSERFNEQKEKHKEWGLVLVKDVKVVEAFEKISFTSSLSTKIEYSGHFEAYSKGVEDGKKFSISDKIANEDETEIMLLG